MGAHTLARRDEIGHPEPEIAVGFVLEQLGAILEATRLLEPPLPTRFGLRSDDRLHGEIMRSVCRYLDIAPPTDPNDRPTKDRT